MSEKESLPVAEKNEIIVYQPEGGEFHIEVRVENETVWLTQAQMAELFATDRTSINRHIRNFFQTQELNEKSTCAKIAQVRMEGERAIKRIQPYQYVQRKKNSSLLIHMPTTWFFRLCRSVPKECKRPSILPGLPVPCGRRKPA